MNASKYKHVFLGIIFPEDPIVFYFWRLSWLSAVVVGTFMVYGAKQGIANYAAVDSWPSTTGTVVESSVVEEMLPADPSSGRFEYIYRPRIVYEYKINGRSFKSNDVGSVPLSIGLRRTADAVVKTYPVGAAVKVFYNPNNSKYAVLERSGAFKVALVGNLLFFLGAALAAFGHGITWELGMFEERRSVYEEDGDTSDEARAKRLFLRALLTTAVLGYSLLACSLLSLITASFMKHGLSLAANHVLDVVGAGFDDLVKSLSEFVILILASAAVSLGISNRVVAVIVGCAIFCLLFLTVHWLL